VVVRAANLAIEHLQFKLGRHHVQSDLEWQRRASTLGGILTSLVTVIVGFVSILMLLRELSIDVLPILTGAGIAGLAIGFGAQNLVRDVISGFFLILEDQVRIGDLARINAITGLVEEINLRTIVLRDADAAVHVFPNGTITALANLSKGYSYAVVDVRIAYTENLDRVFGSIREVGASLLLQMQPGRAELSRLIERWQTLARRHGQRLRALGRAQSSARGRAERQHQGNDIEPGDGVGHGDGGGAMPRERAHRA